MKASVLKLLARLGLVALSGALAALGTYLSTSNPVVAGLVGVFITKAVDYINDKLNDPAFRTMKAMFGPKNALDELPPLDGELPSQYADTILGRR